MTKAKAARLDRRLTQAQLGAIAGIATAQVSLIETGRLVPSNTQRQKLAAALSLGPFELQDEAEQEAPCAG